MAILADVLVAVSASSPPSGSQEATVSISVSLDERLTALFIAQQRLPEIRYADSYNQ